MEEAVHFEYSKFGNTLRLREKDKLRKLNNDKFENMMNPYMMVLITFICRIIT